MNISQLIRELEASKHAYKQVNDKFNALKSLREDSARELETLEKQILSYMQENGVYQEEINVEEGFTHVLTYLKPKQVVDIPLIDAIPDEFCRLERKPNKAAIKEYLKENQVNWGCLSDGKASFRLDIKRSPE